MNDADNNDRLAAYEAGWRDGDAAVYQNNTYLPFSPSWYSYLCGYRDAEKARVEALKKLNFME